MLSYVFKQLIKMIDLLFLLKVLYSKLFVFKKKTYFEKKIVLF